MLQGICVAICTTFDKTTQAFDEKAYLKHLDRMLEAGVHIVAVCGGTGEFAHLETEERRRIAEVTARHIEGKARLIVHASAARTMNAVEAAKHAEGLGAAAVLVLPAIFVGADADGVFKHYETIGRAVKTPIMAYNIPQNSGFDITPEYYERLRGIPSVQYIKDSTGDLMRIERLITQGANVFNGCDYFSLYALMAGAAGCFWGGANVMPVEAVRLYNLVTQGKLVEAGELWKKMKATNMFFWNNPYNASVKAAAQLRGHDLGECRLPVLPLTAEKVAELKKALAPLL